MLVWLGLVYRFLTRLLFPLTAARRVRRQPSLALVPIGARLKRRPLRRRTIDL